MVSDRVGENEGERRKGESLWREGGGVIEKKRGGRRWGRGGWEGGRKIL